MQAPFALSNTKTSSGCGGLRRYLSALILVTLSPTAHLSVVAHVWWGYLLVPPGSCPSSPLVKSRVGIAS